jgi:hypothetical protein
MDVKIALQQRSSTDKKQSQAASELDKFILFYEQPTPIKKRRTRLDRTVKRSLK